MRRTIYSPYNPVPSRQSVTIKKQDFLPIQVPGGIGDLIVSLAWIETFRECPLPVRIYTSYPAIAKLFITWAEVFETSAGSFNFHIVLADTVEWKFRIEEEKKSLHPYLADKYNIWLKQLPRWDFAISGHPHNGNEMARMAVKLGIRRWEMSFEFIAESYKPFDFDIDALLPGRDHDYRLYDIPFITIHDGFDANHHIERSMKSWSKESWISFVKLFKEEFPYIKVVQLGSGRDKVIEGIDINLVGKLEFIDSLHYLNKSILHVDTDSGLVHARKLLRKRSVVLFGPTNIDYFGYPENTNIAPYKCGDCWWIKPNWMKTCVMAHPAPLCMDSISPELVLYHVSSQIKRGL